MPRVFARGPWGVLAVVVISGWTHARPSSLSNSDRRYLRGVYRDTWESLSLFVSSPSGLPLGNSLKGPGVTITDVGFYAAACAVAGQTNLIPPDQARRRLEAVFTAMEKWPRYLGGFPATSIDVVSGKVVDPTFSTVDHLSRFLGGMLVVKGLYPDLAPQVDKVLTPMNWDALRDPEKGLFRGGWRWREQTFAVEQKGWEWYYPYLGADTRLAYLWGIGTGQIPGDTWFLLDRGMEEKYGLSFLTPGWHGGLAALFDTGLFVDERATLFGKSAADFAWAQMLHAERIESPVWGWTPCVSPDGKHVLGWGALRDDVVSPAAAALAAVYYPRRAVLNLRRLQASGARAALMENKKRRSLGFRDSFDWRASRSCGVMTTANQGRIFLSLANVLHEGLLWKAVSAQPSLRRALKDVPDESVTFPEVASLYRERDGTVPLPPVKRKKKGVVPHEF